MRSGGTPNLADTPATSSVSLLIVLISVTFSSTSCARSLSPVEITTLKPPLAAMQEIVPIASSASMPGTVSTGQPSSFTASTIGSICSARSEGIAVRVALYSGYQSSRKVLPLSSKTQAPCAAGYCSRSSFIIETTPRIAPVGTPPGPRRSGSAW